ncbi:Hsp20/alpha crystallin family protein [Roseateles sp. L2-2]|uniref:Hsp20/alpha crystallin family protein n=1 Tax=Roseateles sp. L2-2 TaxID=3422597 RepID=UPI000B4DB784|nr:heat-shock protein Hsp20 [Roseateles noduli]
MFDSASPRSHGLLEQLAQLQQALSRSLTSEAFPDGIRAAAAGSFPPINVGRTERSVEVYAFAPGLEAQTIDVTVERGVLRISGERRPTQRGSAEATQVYAAERWYGRFSRAVTLPDDADTANVEASYRDGVLRVSIGLREAARPQRINVQ